MNNFLVSIIIPVYNLQDYIDKCIFSCLNQTFRQIEILTINDGSTDNSEKVLKNYLRLDSRIKIFNKEHAGTIAARKDGIEQASGDYVFFLDGDDYLPEDAIEKLVKRAEETNADIIDGNYVFVDETGNKFPHKNYSFDVLEKEEYLATILKNRQVYLCFKLIRKSLFLNIESPEKLTLGEDAVWFVQLVNNAGIITKCDHVIYYYFRRENSVTVSPKPYDLKMAYEASEWVYKFLSIHYTSRVIDIELKKLKALNIILYLRRLKITGSYRNDVRTSVSLCFKNYTRKDLNLSLFEYFILKLSSVSVLLSSLFINSNFRIKRLLYLISRPVLSHIK